MTDEVKRPPLAIEWSVAGAVRSGDGGKLTTTVPPEVAEALGLHADDVMCWTGFVDGTVEVWSVAKSPYSSLDEPEKRDAP
jgi:hypothetical protein